MFDAVCSPKILEGSFAAIDGSMQFYDLKAKGQPICFICISFCKANSAVSLVFQR